MKYFPTRKVWQGVLTMFREPEIVSALGQPDKLGAFPQKKVDSVLRAVQWAQAMEKAATK